MLASCGFHLRGKITLPKAFTKLHITTKTHFSPFMTTLQRTFIQRGITIVDHSDSVYVLTLLNVSDSDQMITRVGGAEAASYAFKRTVGFSLAGPKGQLIIKPTQVSVTKIYTTNVTQLLIANRHKAELSKAMDQALADQILLRLTDLPQ